MYSKDRRAQLDFTISCLREMNGYNNCQKTLVVDGKTNYVPEDFEVIQVPRINNQFCWGRMWEAGVATARFSNVLYIDSDRLLPKTYLEKIMSVLGDNKFVFTSRHFMVLDQNISKEECTEILNSDFSIFGDPRFSGRLRYEPRFQQPFPGPGKNVMSGNTAFTKETFYALNGVDQWYCGHGAYADTDFHMAAGKFGCEFIDLQEPELHCHHYKLDKSENLLSVDELHKLSLDNFIYYVWKWELPAVLAENLAYECRSLNKPREYVDSKLEFYAKEFVKTNDFCLV